MNERLLQLAARDWANQAMLWVLPLHLLLIFLLYYRTSGRGPRRDILPPPLIFIMAGALILRCVVLPLSRHYFDGHEADYFDAWRGLEGRSAMGYRWYPMVATLYRLMGSLFNGDGMALKAITLAISVLGLWGIYHLGKSLLSHRLWALLLTLCLACDPVHGFWSSSAYNVILPFTLGVFCLYFTVNALGRMALGPLTLAALLGVLAVAARIESGLLIFPILGLLCLQGRRLLSQGFLSPLLALSLTASFGLFHAIAMGLFIARPEGADSPFEYAEAMFALQWSDFSSLAPYDHPAILIPLALATLCLLMGSKASRRLLFFALLLILPSHFMHAFFDDYGTRHSLFMRLGLFLVLVGGLQMAWQGSMLLSGRTAAQPIPSLGRIWATLALSLSLTALPIFMLQGGQWQGDGRRYYATAADFFDDHDAFATARHLRVEPLAKRCVFIAESLFYADFEVVSHFEVLDPIQRKKLIDAHGGCLIYVFDLENYQLASRGIWERANKIHRHFELELLGKRVRPQMEDYSLLYRVKGLRVDP